MTGSQRLDAVFALLALLLALLFLGQLVWGTSPLYTRVFTPGVLLWIGAAAKTLSLLVAFVFAWKSAALFELENPVRRSWMLLAMGLLAMALGQLVLALYQLVLSVRLPFPSPADAFFLLAYPILIAALVGFIRAYRDAGYALGERYGALSLALALLFGALDYVVLVPILRASATPIERLLNAAYPTLDFVALVPIVLLIRMTQRFRGGSVWRVWAGLLAGFAFMCAGDILYGYLSALKQVALDPVVDAMFLLSYVAFAWGANRQYELLRG
jgi:hypothetical protein